MEEQNEQLQYVEQPEMEYDVEQEVFINRAQSSLNWGITGLVVQFVMYILMALVGAMGASSTHTNYYGRSSAAETIGIFSFIMLLASIFFLVMSIIKLISGIRGVRGRSRVKAILGIIFNIQNIFIFAIYISLFAFISTLL